MEIFRLEYSDDNYRHLATGFVTESEKIYTANVVGYGMSTSKVYKTRKNAINFTSKALQELYVMFQLGERPCTYNCKYKWVDNLEMAKNKQI